MTVKELIEILEKYSKNDIIEYYDSEYGYEEFQVTTMYDAYGKRHLVIKG